jgi:hypothetical protein
MLIWIDILPASKGIKSFYFRDLENFQGFRFSFIDGKYKFIVTYIFYIHECKLAINIDDEFCV